MLERNQVILRGTLVRKNEYADHVVLQIATDGSDRISPKALVNVVFFEPQKVAAFDANYRVTVIGHMQINRAKTENKNKNKFLQGVIGDQIEETKRIVAQEFAELSDIDPYDGGMPSDINKVLLAGEVTGVYSPNEKTTCISIRSKSGDRRSYNRAQFYCFYRQNTIAATVSKGDYVAAVCAIRTDNVKSIYMPFREILYCKDLVLLDHDPE